MTIWNNVMIYKMFFLIIIGLIICEENLCNCIIIGPVNGLALLHFDTGVATAAYWVHFKFTHKIHVKICLTEIQNQVIICHNAAVC